MKRAVGARRETVIVPLGYMTTPNQYGVFPEGALAKAENVLMRYKGKLITAPDATIGQSTGNDSTYVCYKLMPLDAGHVYTFAVSGTTWDVGENNVSGSIIPAALSTTNLFPYGRTSPVRSRERMLVNTNQGVIVGDSMAPTNIVNRALRQAGLTQTVMRGFSLTAGTNFPIPSDIMVGYSALITREYADGYIVKSVPSPIVKILNATAGAVKISFSVACAAAEAFDIIEVYRTDGLSTTSVDADPGTTLKLIIRHTLTTADITAGNVFFNDETLLLAPFYSTTGKELYTNQYQEGETGGNRQPDINGAQAVYKGFTFFGNITERPQAELSVSGGMWGPSSMAANANIRANAVGGRSVTGTITSGSPTITGISAADIVGIAVGQEETSGFFPTGARVTSVGASTVTFNKNATSSGTVTTISDIIEISILPLVTGEPAPTAHVPNVLTLLSDLGLGNTLEVTTNQAASFNNLASDGLGVTIVIEPSRPNVASFTVRATNGALYSPPLPSISITPKTFSQINTPNLLRWSKDSEPEHVPSVNETRVGSGKILQLVSTKDALWIFCSDGIFRLSGDAGVWQVNIIAPGCVLCSPGCATSMRDAVYAYTNYGFVSVTDAGVVPLSDLQIKDQLPGPSYVEGATPNGFVVNNDDDEEVLIFVGFPAPMFYVYNARHNAFTYIKNGPVGRLNAMTTASYQQSPAAGVGLVIIANNSPLVGQTASWLTWNSPSSFLSPVVQYRALYAKNPLNTKQWIDCTYFFENLISFGMSGTLSGAFVGNASAGVGFNDSYVTIGVPRKYAIAPSLEPGFLIGNSGVQYRFEGVSCRVIDMGIQQVLR